MAPNRDRVQLKIHVSEQEKEWAEELARDAEKSVTELLRDYVVAAHAEKMRKESRVQSEKIKLTPEMVWIYRRIEKGGPLGESISIEVLDHDSRAQFGDEIVFSRGEMLTRLREHGYIRRVGPYGRDFEVAKKLPKS